MGGEERTGARESRPRSISLRIALHFAAAATILLLLYPGLHDVPITRDEAVYQYTARVAQSWFRALANDPLAAVSDEGIRRYWSPIPEHPEVAKVLAALSSTLFGRWFDPIVAYRLGNALLAVLLVFEIFHFMRRYFGLSAAFFAATSTLLIPPLYGHACITAMDFPMAALGLLATTAFVRGLERPAWAVIFGVYLGLALNTKINGAFVAIPLVLWAALYRRKDCALNLYALLVIAPVVCILTWPWLWHHTFERLLGYGLFHLHHSLNRAIYFGRIYADEPAPWPYPFVYFFVTIPIVVLLPMAAGALQAAVGPILGRRPQPELVLLLLALLTPVIVCALPHIPRYDGPRLFLNAFPFVACVAGVGFAQVLVPGLRRLLSPLASITAPIEPVVLGAALLLSAASSVWRIHPFEPYSYYNLLVGGTAGAVRRGLSPVQWAMAGRKTVDYLNRHAHRGDVIYNRTGATAPLQEYQIVGLLRRSLKWGERPDWVVLDYNLAYSDWSDWWLFYDDKHPRYEKVSEIRADGVPVLGIFRARSQPLRDAAGAIASTAVMPLDEYRLPR
jgi:Dolichyl-phosphate-mannose-protein mannosyltransferase